MFGAIGFHYRDFRQISDEEVIEILQRFPAGKPCHAHWPAALTSGNLGRIQATADPFQKLLCDSDVVLMVHHLSP
jgi:hypothetical protein